MTPFNGLKYRAKILLGRLSRKVMIVSPRPDFASFQAENTEERKKSSRARVTTKNLRDRDIHGVRMTIYIYMMMMMILSREITTTTNCFVALLLWIMHIDFLGFYIRPFLL
jgi:hypothetical protein